MSLLGCGTRSNVIPALCATIFDGLPTTYPKLRVPFPPLSLLRVLRGYQVHRSFPTAGLLTDGELVDMPSFLAASRPLTSKGDYLEQSGPMQSTTSTPETFHGKRPCNRESPVAYPRNSRCNFPLVRCAHGCFNSPQRTIYTSGLSCAIF